MEHFLILVAAFTINQVNALPTIEDNKLPTDEELMSGQPEVILPLNLPTDEESFNQLNLLLSSPHSGFKPPGTTSGTYHFVSSTFPEVDARGFHESVFDGIGDYFPSWPKTAAKRGNEVQDYSPSITDQLGITIPRHSFWKRSVPSRDYWLEPSLARKKREIKFVSKSGYSNGTKNDSHAGSHGSVVHQFDSEKNHSGRIKESGYWENSSNRKKRSGFSRSYGLESRLRRARGSMGFHADTFSDGFGDFQTMKRSSEKNLLNKLGSYLEGERQRNFKQYLKDYNHLMTAGKRRPEMDSSGFHGDTFGGGFGYFETMKKRRPEMDSMGFHGDTFGGGFGDFETMKKRRPEMDSMGFHGDTFGGGFGDFETMKKRRPEMDSMGFHGDTFGGGFGDFETMKKRRPEMDSMGFHGDTFGGGFGDFETMKKRRPEMDSMGFHGDTFGGGFGDFETMKKRRPEMDSMGFHGDTFGGGFGDFETMKKRRPEMDSMGFHGDTFGGNFGDFETMKKRRPEMDSTGFHGDTFGGSFGDFETMKKRRPEMDSMGFHGDTFGGGFGDFETMKKRRPDMDSSGFHGDTFSRGFGEFYPMKRKDSLLPAHQTDGKSLRHSQPSSKTR